MCVRPCTILAHLTDGTFADGAALFFTSHARPTSFAKLRSYILHRLFTAPALPLLPGAPAVPLAVTTSATARSFPFATRANVVDRDQVLVPTGWDSWGKIRILRDRYDADAVGKGWDLDMELERERLAGRPAGADEDRVDDDGRRVVSALRMYEEVVVDLDADDQVRVCCFPWWVPRKLTSESLPSRSTWPTRE